METLNITIRRTQFYRLFSLWKDFVVLQRLGQRVVMDLREKGWDTPARRQRIESLLFYRPDRITREVLSGGYFSTDAFMVRLEDALQSLIRAWFRARLEGRRCSWVSRTGRITRPGRDLIAGQFRDLPAPFLRRLRTRLKYVSFQGSPLSEEYVRLEHVFASLRDKGVYCLGRIPPYSRSLEFEEVVAVYLQYRGMPDFVQKILEHLDVIHVSKDTGNGRNGNGQNGHSRPAVAPIAEDKALAKCKKTYYDLLNRYAQDLSQDQRKSVVDRLLKCRAETDFARLLVQHLQEGCRTMDFEDAWHQAVETAHREGPDERKSLGQMQIGPKGLVTAEGLVIKGLLSKSDGNNDRSTTAS